ncbi:hypothetical protein, partial [Burkholderia gladioli]
RSGEACRRRVLVFISTATNGLPRQTTANGAARRADQSGKPAAQPTRARLRQNQMAGPWRCPQHRGIRPLKTQSLRRMFHDR